jgi:NitT/TauT family transport system substrate-binding protein
LARTEGIDIVAFAGGTYEDNSHQLHAVVVKPDSGISKCSDLKGKTIAVNTKRNIDHLLLNSWLRSNGVFPESVSLSEIPFPRMETVLQGGGVDAIAVVEPFLTHAKDVGFIAIGNYFLSGNVGRIDVTSYCAKSSWLEKNNKVAKAFKDALNEAIEYSNKHEKEVRDTIAKWTRLDTKLTDKIGVPGFSFFPSENGVNYLIKKLNEEKFITKKITAKELLKN